MHKRGPCIIYEKVDMQSELTYKVKNQRGRLRRGQVRSEHIGPYSSIAR